MHNAMHHSDLRIIELSEVTAKVKSMILSANYNLGEDIKAKLNDAIKTEESVDGD